MPELAVLVIYSLCLVWFMGHAILFKGNNPAEARQKSARVTHHDYENDRYGDEQVTGTCNTLSFLQWNMCGLQGKLKDIKFKSFIMTYDFIYFDDTFMEDLTPAVVSN